MTSRKIKITILDMTGFIITGIVIFLAIFGGFIIPYDPTVVSNTVSQAPPTFQSGLTCFGKSCLMIFLHPIGLELIHQV